MNTLAADIAAATGQGHNPIVATLREAIRQGLLPAGKQLVQADLAAALGVSRIPVREALQYLSSEGLVVFTDQGVKVTSLTAEEVHELWTFRSVVEPAMAERIVANLGAGDLREVTRLVAAMDDVDSPVDWLDLNYHFHTKLYEIAKSPHFARAAIRALTLIEPHSRVSVIVMNRRAVAQQEHHEMLAALQERDEVAMADLLRVHCVRPREELIAWSKGQDGEGPSPVHVANEAKEFVARLSAAKPH